METVSGVNNWKLLLRRETAGITILRAVTCDERASLPEELFGLPVTVLGDHALAPNAPAVPGEAVQVTCGPLPDENGWDNRRLRGLTLPRHRRRVGDYALLHCAGENETAVIVGVFANEVDATGRCIDRTGRAVEVFDETAANVFNCKFHGI